MENEISGKIQFGKKTSGKEEFGKTNLGIIFGQMWYLPSKLQKVDWEFLEFVE